MDRLRPLNNHQYSWARNSRQAAASMVMLGSILTARHAESAVGYSESAPTSCLLVRTNDWAQVHLPLASVFNNASKDVSAGWLARGDFVKVRAVHGGLAE